MYLRCENNKCFWHSDAVSNRCTRGLVTINDKGTCIVFQKRAKLNAEEFCQAYCVNCDSQQCEGIGTELFENCCFKNDLREE